MTEWQRAKLGDIINTNVSSYGAGNSWDTFKYLDTGNITKNVITDIQNFEAFADLPSRARRKVKDGDIIYSSVRPNQRHYGIIRNPSDNLLVSTGFVVLETNSAIADSRFVYYYLTQDEIVEKLQTIAEHSTSAYPSIRPQDIIDLILDIPPLEEQKAIAGVLGSLDDKIEANRRENETLEAMAQALFKSWFIDFDPFGGSMPDDWQEKPIGDSAKTVLGGTPSRDKKEYWDGTIPWINSGEINKFRIIAPSEYITEEGLNRSATKLMPSRTCVLAITGATLGQVSLTEIETCANQSVVGILGNDILPSEYIYLFVKHNIQSIINKQTGGAQQHINKNNIDETLVIVPGAEVMKNFINATRSLFDKIKINEFQSHTLAQIRDVLLPRLMSGKVTVK